MHIPRQLGDLDQPLVRGRAGEDEAGVLELLAQMVVDLVTVPVALVNDAFTVGVIRPACPGGP